MRSMTLLFTLLVCAGAAAVDQKPVRYVGRESPYPLWDGKESVADYARRTGLDPEISFDLGNDVKLELVLIPAGQFVMGFPEPQPPAIAAGFLLAAAVVFFLAPVIMLSMNFAMSRQFKRRFQLSLRLLLISMLLIGISGVLLVQWREISSQWDHYNVTHDDWQYHTAPEEIRGAYGGVPIGLPIQIRTPFYLGKYEVTVVQARQLIGAEIAGIADYPWDFSFGHGPSIVDCLEPLSNQFGYLFRLPYETEWEYACRAGTKTWYFFGDNWEDGRDYAVLGNDHAPLQVGTKKPNGFGLYDMHGNLWELGKRYH